MRAPDGSAGSLTAQTSLEVRQVLAPNLFHDRIWIVGESSVMVGASINGFLTSGDAKRASTAAELPFADARAWRDLFERWWVSARSLT